MTYRRLFLHLLTGCTLALSAVWTGSLWYEARAVLTCPLANFMPSVKRGTFRLVMTRGEGTSLSYSAHADVGRLPSGVTDPMTGKWNWISTTTNHGRSRFDMLDLPVWVPYLLAVGSAFCFCRFMERGSRRDRSPDMS